MVFPLQPYISGQFGFNHFFTASRLVDPDADEDNTLERFVDDNSWGWSYGGYATMAGLAFYPDLYACGISMYGISDLVEFGKIPFASNNFWRNAVGNANSAKESTMLREHSPFYSAEKIKAPMRALREKEWHSGLAEGKKVILKVFSRISFLIA